MILTSVSRVLWREIPRVVLLLDLLRERDVDSSLHKTAVKSLTKLAARLFPTDITLEFTDNGITVSSLYSMRCQILLT